VSHGGLGQERTSREPLSDEQEGLGRIVGLGLCVPGSGKLFYPIKLFPLFFLLKFHIDTKLSNCKIRHNIIQHLLHDWCPHSCVFHFGSFLSTNS
jgi:hypothetical protein